MFSNYTIQMIHIKNTNYSQLIRLTTVVLKLVLNVAFVFELHYIINHISYVYCNAIEK